MNICYECIHYDETKTRQCTVYNNDCEPNEEATYCCEFILKHSLKSFYRLFYIDSGNCYTYKDYDNEAEAIEEAKRISKSLIKYIGNDGNTKLEKHIIEQVDFNH